MADEDDDDRGVVMRERSPSYAGSKVMELLGVLRGSKHAARIKSLKKFQDYINKYSPEFYDDDVELLLLGSSSLDGLVAWSGYKSQKGEEVLKTTSRSVLQLVHFLVARNTGNAENLFLEKFLELSQEELQRMQLSLHIMASDETEPLELLTLLLSRHRSPDGQPDPIDLNLLIPTEEARAKFTRWLQQSATEQELMSRIEKQKTERNEAAAAKAAAMEDSPTVGIGKAGSPKAPIELSSLNSELKREVIRTMDPLGVNTIDLVSAEAARTRGEGASGMGGKTGPGHVRGSTSITSSLLAAKERINLLQKLQQAPFGGGPSSGAGKGKYTRNRNRAMKATADANHQAMVGVSIVPQDENFDPSLFLTIVHGTSSFDDLRRGQENLEKAMGSQANQLQQLVNEHYESFVRCADGIHWFKNMIAEEFISPQSSTSRNTGGSSDRDPTKIGQLLDIVSQTQEGARTIFSPLLDRMEKTRNLRSARLMLQRLAKVLDVPGRMSKFMKLGQYEDVVKEYERVKGLPIGSGMSLLKRVQDQAEIVAEELRRKLKAYISSDAHLFEDLQEASELLYRLGGAGEPLLYCFVEQHRLLTQNLDSLDSWYQEGMETALRHKMHREEAAHRSQTRSEEKAMGKRLVDIPANLMATLGNRKGRLLDTDSENSEDSEEEEDEENSEAGKPMLLASPLMGLSRGRGTKQDWEGSDQEQSDVESEFSGDEAEGEEAEWVLDFSINVELDSIEHESASLRLNLVRKVVTHAHTYLPTLIRLSGLVVDELPSAKVVVDTKTGAMNVVKQEEKPKLGAVPNPDEQYAGVAVSDQVCKTLQRISKSVRKAMFGEQGGSGAIGSVQLQALKETPLATVYFREALKSSSELYDSLFSTEVENLVTRAALPSLKALVEEGQVQHSQNVLRRLKEEAGQMYMREQWMPATEDGGLEGWPMIKAGTRLPWAFFNMAYAALEELATYLIRPSWVAHQVTYGLDASITQFLGSLKELAHPTHVPGIENNPVPQDVRLLALMGNFIQLKQRYVPLLVDLTNRLFESDRSVSYASQILELHDEMMQTYVDKKASEVEAAIRAGWVRKTKGLHTCPKAAVPSYLVQVLMTFVRAKSEVKDSLADLPLLTEEEEEEEVDPEDPDVLRYMEVIMKRVAQAALSCLMNRINELIASLGVKKVRKEPYAVAVHAAFVEATFFINSIVAPYLNGEQERSTKSTMDKLRALAADVEDEDDDQGSAKYTVDFLKANTKVYLSSLGQ